MFLFMADSLFGCLGVVKYFLAEIGRNICLWSLGWGFAGYIRYWVKTGNTLNVYLLVLWLWRIASFFHASVIAGKSRVMGFLTSAIRDKRSTTTLSLPDMCWMSEVYWQTKFRQGEKLARGWFVGLMFQSKDESFMVGENCKRRIFKRISEVFYFEIRGY